MQFVVGLHSVPYLLIAFLYHSLKSIPRRDALFFALLRPDVGVDGNLALWCGSSGSLVPWRSGGTSPQSCLSPVLVGKEVIHRGVFHSVENFTCV